MFSTIPSRIAKAFPGGGPPPAWTPADFTNLWDWWASDSGVSLSGSNVISWTGYNSNVLTPFNVSHYPSFSASDSYFGSNPSITINPAGVDGIDCGFNVNLPSNTTSKTTIVIGRLIQKFTSGDDTLIAWGPGFIPRAGIWGSLANSSYWLYNNVSGDVASYNGTTFVNGDYQILMMTYDRTAGNLDFFTGNSITDLDTPTLTRNVGSGVNFTGGIFGLSNYVGAYGPSPKISVVESIFINGIPTAGEIANFQNYLNTKYAPSYILDSNPGAVYAYSVRKLSSTYTGPAMRVRRSSDNTELDIGFSWGQQLDISALVNFCSGTDGYVKTWYDQSGNGNHATQTNSANQPQIVSGGVMNTVSGLGYATPAIRFYGSDDYFNLPLVFNSATAATVFSVNKTVSNGGGFWNYNNDNGGATHHPWTDNNVYEGFGSTSRYGFSSEGLFVNQHLYTVMSKSNDWQAFINGVSKYTSGSNTVYFPNSGDGVPPTPPRLGVNASLAFFYNGFYQEHIVYTSDKLSSRTAIEGNINNYYNIF